MKQKTKFKKTTLRMPKDQVEALKRAAEREGRTLNAQCARVLSEYLKQAA